MLRREARRLGQQVGGGGEEGSVRRGQANQDGTAVGRVVELWHRLGETGAAFEDALRQAQAEGGRYPEADWDLVRRWALCYASDPRNRGVVLPDSQEREVRVTLPCAPEDPSGMPVELVGHPDQVRRDPVTKFLRVWDLKSGAKGGRELVVSYAWQLAAYALACTETMGEVVLPGGVIRLRGYVASTRPADAPVFWAAEWSLDQCRVMVASAVQHVAWLRAGLVHLQPGPHCMWCPGLDPGTCGDRVARVLETSPALFLPGDLDEDPARDEADV